MTGGVGILIDPEELGILGDWGIFKGLEGAVFEGL